MSNYSNKFNPLLKDGLQYVPLTTGNSTDYLGGDGAYHAVPTTNITQFDATIGTGGTYAEPQAAFTAGKFRLLQVGTVIFTGNVTVPNVAEQYVITTISKALAFNIGIYKFTGGGSNKPSLNLEKLNITPNASTNLLADFTGYLMVNECSFSESFNLSTVTPDIKYCKIGTTTSGVKKCTINAGVTKATYMCNRSEATLIDAGTATEEGFNTLF